MRSSFSWLMIGFCIFTTAYADATLAYGFATRVPMWIRCLFRAF